MDDGLAKDNMHPKISQVGYSGRREKGETLFALTISGPR